MERPRGAGGGGRDGGGALGRESARGDTLEESDAGPANGVGSSSGSARSYETVKAQIISSLFSHAESNGKPSELLITYIKIWEDLPSSTGQPVVRDQAQRKPRYILVTEVSQNKRLIHKAKRNTNGSFSIGKTWDLAELKALKGISQSSFLIGLGKSYIWHAERQNDPAIFVPALVKAYAEYTYNKPLEVDGFPFALTAAETSSKPRNGAVGESSSGAVAENSAAGKRASIGRTKSPASEQKLDEEMSRLHIDDAPLSPSEAVADGAKANNFEAEQDAILLNVEEMLENFDWRRAAKASGQKGGAAIRELVGSGKGNADLIEARLLSELNALDAASIHSIIESDDRIDSVLLQLDKAIHELDSMYQMLNIYRTELESMGDDISYIESQNRGLQVLTANQKALLAEMERLLQVISIDQETLNSIKTGSFQTIENIKGLEAAASVLYQALALADDPMLGMMAVVRDKVEEYRGYSQQLAKRLADYLSIYLRYQANELTSDKARQPDSTDPRLRDHQPIEDYFGRFCGLMLFTKEVEPVFYEEIKTRYISEMSEAYRKEFKDFLGLYRMHVRKATPEELDVMIFEEGSPATLEAGTIKRAGTLYRSTALSRDMNGDRDSSKMPANLALSQALKQILPVVGKEQSFMTDFLHISTEPVSFSDYLGLDPSFKLGLNRDERTLDAVQAMRDALEGIFAFLTDEVKQWLDWALKLDPLQIVGILAVLDELLDLCDKQKVEYMRRLVESQHRRLSANLDQLISDQAKPGKEAQTVAKRRQGEASFASIFPNLGKEGRASTLGASDKRNGMAGTLQNGEARY